MNQDTLFELKDLATRHSCVGELLKEYDHLTQSPLMSSYEATYATIERYNEQLSNNDIDILNPDDKAKFEMAHKYLTELPGYLKTLEDIQNRMSPDQQEKSKDLQKKKKLEKNNAVAM